MPSDIDNYDITESDAEIEAADDEDEIEHPTVGIDVTYSIGDVTQEVGTFAFQIVDETLAVWEYLGESAATVRDGKHRGEIFAAIALDRQDCYAIKGRSDPEKKTVFTIGTDRNETLVLNDGDLSMDDLKRFKRLSQDFDTECDGCEFFEDGDGRFPIIESQTACTKLATYYWIRARYEKEFYAKTDDPVRDGLRSLWRQRAESTNETVEVIGEVSA